MPKSIPRSYSHATREANVLFGALLQTARKERGLTQQEVAERVGVSRGMLRRIEQGDPKCEIGVAFEVATLLGVPLFGLDDERLQHERHAVQQRLALLPAAVHKRRGGVRDDF